jgi:hypothetical protein
LDVTDLQITFVSNVVVYYCLVHNIFLGQKPEEVARMLEILQHDRMIPHVDDDPLLDPVHEAAPATDFVRTNIKQTELRMYLGRCRNLDI